MKAFEEVLRLPVEALLNLIWGEYRMKRLKLARIVAILLAAVLVVSACSSGNSGGGSTDNAGNGNAPSNATSDSNTGAGNQGGNGGNDPAPPKPEKQPDPVELTIHAWGISESVQAAIDLFTQEYPWITVKHNGSAVNWAFINNIIAGEDSDIVFLDRGLSEWITGGNDLLLELTPFIEKDERIQNAKLNEGMLNSHQLGNGKIYTLPFADIPMWIAVNLELLDQYGLELPSYDWTYDDMLQMAKVATDPNANTWGMYGVIGWFFHTLPVANGHAENYRLMSEGNLRSVADTPGVLADLQWLQDLIHKENVHPNKDQIAQFGIKNDNGAAFVDGNILFTAIADWDLPTLANAAFEWDVLPFPRGAVRQVTYRHVGPAAITKASKDPEEAFMFLSFLFSEEAQKAMIENGSAAWVQSPELENYYDQVDIWKGRNTEVVKMSAKMGLYTTDPGVINLTDLQYKINDPLVKMINEGGNFSDIIPFVEEYNKNAAETRKALGLE
jgi:ABC-type glycerol-3-phosphate transport system substrate-binding protein